MKLSTGEILMLALPCLLLLAEGVPLGLGSDSRALRRELDPKSIHLSRMLNLLQSRTVHKIEPRSITAFVTDPALLVTILHSLEIAYWTLPFGIILKPIINLFRMPNRRMGSRDDIDNLKVQHFYQTLAKAIDKIEKLNGRANHAKSTSMSQQATKTVSNASI